MIVDFIDAVIEHGVPIPPKQRFRYRYPYKNMEVGDSFHSYIDVSNHTAMYSKKLGMKFLTRRTRNGWRVWRTK